MLRRGGDIATPLRVSFGAEMRGFFGHAIPGMIASASPQLLVVAGAVIASSQPSAVSWLYFANRLVELPLGIVGVAMGAVLVPELTRALRGGDATALAHAQSRGLELAVGLAVPATLGLIDTERARRSHAVRTRRLHRIRHCCDRAGAEVACAWPARARAVQGAVAGVLRARRYAAPRCVATLKGFAVAIVLSVVLGQIFGASRNRGQHRDSEPGAARSR